MDFFGHLGRHFAFAWQWHGWPCWGKTLKWENWENHLALAFYLPCPWPPYLVTIPLTCLCPCPGFLFGPIWLLVLPFSFWFGWDRWTFGADRQGQGILGGPEEGGPQTVPGLHLGSWRVTGRGLASELTVLVCSLHHSFKQILCWEAPSVLCLWRGKENLLLPKFCLPLSMSLLQPGLCSQTPTHFYGFNCALPRCCCFTYLPGYLLPFLPLVLFSRFPFGGLVTSFFCRWGRLSPTDTHMPHTFYPTDPNPLPPPQAVNLVILTYTALVFCAFGPLHCSDFTYTHATPFYLPCGCLI